MSTQDEAGLTSLSFWFEKNEDLGFDVSLLAAVVMWIWIWIWMIQKVQNRKVRKSADLAVASDIILAAGATGEIKC